jgi:hypothetical protein
MRGLEWKTILAAAIAGSSLFVAAGAQAHDDDRWREHRHHGRWHHESERRVVYERQPVVYERQPVFVERRPVVVAPAPVYMAPMAPMYSQPVDPSLNFNFSFPLR